MKFDTQKAADIWKVYITLTNISGVIAALLARAGINFTE